MNTAVLCLVTAAARASAFLDSPEASDRDLDPPHPAFVTFRRMTYAWGDGERTEVVASGTRQWLAFLRGSGVERVAVDVEGATWRLLAMRRGGVDVWTASSTEGSATLRATAAADVREGAELGASSERLQRAAADLHDAVHGALRSRPASVRVEELRRALLILESETDGSEVSDVAWPYFVLPERRYDLAARRLFAAAAAAWPQEGDAALSAAAYGAVLAAVNFAPRDSAVEPVQ